MKFMWYHLMARTEALADMVNKLRFARVDSEPTVYCLVNERRRFVPYIGWWEDEGWTTRPIIETLEESSLLKFKLGPPCPSTASLEGKSVDQLIHDPNLMRVYLGSLVSGNGIECGAGNRPIPVSLQADVKYVDAFSYGSDESRSFPGVKNFADFVPVDVVDKIESLEKFDDRSLDFILASHVIEHTPNPIAAMVAAHRVLRDGGKLILIVPDRDRTFDRPREVTEIAHMVLDYEDYQRERDLAHYEEWYSRVVAGTKETARADWEDGVDLHYHCFTQASFMELIAAARRYIAWEGVTFFFPKLHRQDSIEFYVVLDK